VTLPELQVATPNFGLGVFYKGKPQFCHIFRGSWHTFATYSTIHGQMVLDMLNDLRKPLLHLVYFSKKVCFRANLGLCISQNFIIIVSGFSSVMNVEATLHEGVYRSTKSQQISTIQNEN
jgi:hypothetical protein